MNDYMKLRVEVSPCSEDTTDLIAAFLADCGFESFEPDATGLTAYIPAGDYDPQAVSDALSDIPGEPAMTLSAELIEGQDWNAEWEKNYFRPIIIDSRCVIHSSFHTDVPAAKYDIVIDPKMAFGTGHHATTTMMIRWLLQLDLTGKTVIDMGTGTGILGILALMRGAARAYGIEIDPAACVNCRENADLNHTPLEVLEGNSSHLAGLPEADLFMANINRNVILADFVRYAGATRPGGKMAISGFYTSDIPLLLAVAELHGLRLSAEDSIPSDNNPEEHWASLLFERIR
ncbi:MAG: 50S ribosomal protein L11 methyltransferase [Bacteroides sp.]|nr:50S ribosomal protein L11 methyltransferase [Bacteroides sp.]